MTLRSRKFAVQIAGHLPPRPEVVNCQIKGSCVQTLWVARRRSEKRNLDMTPSGSREPPASISWISRFIGD